MHPKSIGIISHPNKRGAPELVSALLKEFSIRGVKLLIESQTANLIGENTKYTVHDLSKDCDLIIVLGGDGTILNTVHLLGKNLRPIFGINVGSLGFLTCLGSSDYKHAVERILSGQYEISNRTLLQVELHTEKRGAAKASTSIETNKELPYYGLNDAVITRGSFSRMVKLEASVDGVLLAEYNADGLILATPTGSTAYSLSAGGPLIAPNSEVFVITPICPHALSNRSVIINDDCVIEVYVCQQRDELFLTIDGQKQTSMHPGEFIRIRKAEQTLPLIMLPDLSFFELARRKLKWSGSAI